MHTNFGHFSIFVFVVERRKKKKREKKVSRRRYYRTIWIIRIVSIASSIPSLCRRKWHQQCDTKGSLPPKKTMKQIGRHFLPWYLGFSIFTAIIIAFDTLGYFNFSLCRFLSVILGDTILYLSNDASFSAHNPLIHWEMNLLKRVRLFSF